MPDSKRGDLQRALFAVADGVLGAGILIMLGTWAGGFLDQKLQTAPWISISLALLGGGLGLARLVIKAINLDGPAKDPTGGTEAKK